GLGGSRGYPGYRGRRDPAGGLPRPVRRRGGGRLPAGHGDLGGRDHAPRRALRRARVRHVRGRRRCGGGGGTLTRPGSGPDPAGSGNRTGSLSTTAGTGATRGPVPAADGPRPRRTIDVDALLEGVLADERPVLARAITLLESTNPAHREKAQELLLGALPHSGGALRIGITGVPGVGKSTFIESLGLHLVEQGHKVAVLAVDPSSTRSGGSILGDKTRMATLSGEPRAYIRPSPTSGTLGGVAKATRETIVLMEAAGFDVILIETVGVGQSEVTVAGMVDCFTFLTLARTGDQLQGIKKGVLELADVVAVNKADGPHVRDAKRAARELES